MTERSLLDIALPVSIAAIPDYVSVIGPVRCVVVDISCVRVEINSAHVEAGYENILFTIDAEVFVAVAG